MTTNQPSLWIADQAGGLFDRLLASGVEIQATPDPARGEGGAMVNLSRAGHESLNGGPTGTDALYEATKTALDDGWLKGDWKP